MTINSPAAAIFAMYVATAEKAGVERARLGGTLQNDILKEYQAQKEFVFPPRPSMRLVRDTITFCTAEMPRWHPISISGYHIREAGSTAAEELAFTLANGFAYVELGLAAGLAGRRVRAAAVASSSTPTSTSSRRSPSTAPPAASGPAGCATATAPSPRKSLALRFHTQTAGVSLTAQQPEVNVARTAIEALAGVLGGTQSLHTNSMDEALALPTEKAARIALRTQQVIAHETGVANVADPLGGSWFVEALTDEMERRRRGDLRPARRARRRLDPRGRLCRDRRRLVPVARSPSRLHLREGKLTNGSRVVVGVNGFTEGNETDSPTSSRSPPSRSSRRSSACRRSRPTATTRPSPRRCDAVRTDRRRPRGEPHAGAARRRPRLRHRGRDHDGHGGRVRLLHRDAVPLGRRRAPELAAVVRRGLDQLPPTGPEL